MNRGDGTADKSENKAQNISDAWIKELEPGKRGGRTVGGGSLQKLAPFLTSRYKLQEKQLRAYWGHKKAVPVTSHSTGEFLDPGLRAQRPLSGSSGSAYLVRKHR